MSAVDMLVREVESLRSALANVTGERDEATALVMRLANALDAEHGMPYDSQDPVGCVTCTSPHCAPTFHFAGPGCDRPIVAVVAAIDAAPVAVAGGDVLASVNGRVTHVADSHARVLVDGCEPYWFPAWPGAHVDQRIEVTVTALGGKETK